MALKTTYSAKRKFNQIWNVKAITELPSYKKCWESMALFSVFIKYYFMFLKFDALGGGGGASSMLPFNNLLVLFVLGPYQATSLATFCDDSFCEVLLDIVQQLFKHSFN